MLKNHRELDFVAQIRRARSFMVYFFSDDGIFGITCLLSNWKDTPTLMAMTNEAATLKIKKTSPNMSTSRKARNGPTKV